MLSQDKEELGWEGLSLTGDSANVIEGDVLLFACKIIVGGEEQHTVAFFALAHGDAGAVPVGSSGFCLLVFVVATGTERRAEVVFVFSKTFNHYSRHARVNTKVGACALGVGFGEVPHGFQAFVTTLIWVWVHGDESEGRITFIIKTTFVLLNPWM